MQSQTPTWISVAAIGGPLVGIIIGYLLTWVRERTKWKAETQRNDLVYWPDRRLQSYEDFIKTTNSAHLKLAEICALFATSEANQKQFTDHLDDIVLKFEKHTDAQLEAIASMALHGSTDLHAQAWRSYSTATEVLNIITRDGSLEKGNRDKTKAFISEVGQASTTILKKFTKSAREELRAAEHLPQ